MLGLLGLLAFFVAIPVVSANVFWFMTAGWLVLTGATFMKGV